MAGDANRLCVLRPETLDQLLDHLEVLLLERSHVLLPEVVRVSRPLMQQSCLQLLFVQVEGGQDVVVGVQDVQHHLQEFADVAVLEHALVQQVQLANGSAGNQVLHQHGRLDEVLDDAHDHADDLLAAVGVQTLRETVHHVQLLLGEEGKGLREERQQPDAQQQLVHELHRVGDAQVEQGAQSR